MHGSCQLPKRSSVVWRKERGKFSGTGLLHATMYGKRPSGVKVENMLHYEKSEMRLGTDVVRFSSESAKQH